MTKQNIIDIVSDATGLTKVETEAVMNGVMKTIIDSLAENGIWFSKGYAANSTCSPSRASIMTGRYSTRFGFEFTPIPDAGRTVLT